LLAAKVISLEGLIHFEANARIRFPAGDTLHVRDAAAARKLTGNVDLRVHALGRDRILPN
jgi:hypothetical protein